MVASITGLLLTTEKFIRKGPAQAEQVLAQDPGEGLDVLGERWALLALREIPLALFKRL
jgi:hypothetical protein